MTVITLLDFLDSNRFLYHRLLVLTRTVTYRSLVSGYGRR